MSLHQLPEGCSSTFFAPAEWPSGFIIGQRASDASPETSAGSTTPLGLLDTSRVKDYVLNPQQHPIDHMANSAPVPTHSLDKWNILIFYILNCPPTPVWFCCPWKYKGGGITIHIAGCSEKINHQLIPPKQCPKLAASWRKDCIVFSMGAHSGCSKQTSHSPKIAISLSVTGIEIWFWDHFKVEWSIMLYNC